MEGYVNLWVNFFYQYQKKYIILKDFLFIINEFDTHLNSFKREREYHVKYMIVAEHTKDHFKVDVTSLNNSVICSLFFSCENEEDSTHWVDSIKQQKLKYEKFLDEFYLNNNTDKLFIENYNPNEFLLKNSKNLNTQNFSFQEFFANIRNFLKTAESDLEYVNINYRLENILNLQDSLIKKIDFYLNEIEKNCFINEVVEYEEFHMKSKKNSAFSMEENKRNHLNKFKELKTLFDELRVYMTDCTFSINSTEIKSYIQNFKEKYLEKLKEVMFLLDQIELNVKAYVSYHVGMHQIKMSELQYLKVDEDEEKLQKFMTIEDDENQNLLNKILQKENMRYKITDLEKENEIIKQFMYEMEY